jgi:hypothetical protein
LGISRRDVETVSGALFRALRISRPRLPMYEPERSR